MDYITSKFVVDGIPIKLVHTMDEAKLIEIVKKAEASMNRLKISDAYISQTALAITALIKNIDAMQRQESEINSLHRSIKKSEKEKENLKKNIDELNNTILFLNRQLQKFEEQVESSKVTNKEENDTKAWIESPWMVNQLSFTDTGIIESKPNAHLDKSKLYKSNAVKVTSKTKRGEGENVSSSSPSTISLSSNKHKKTLGTVKLTFPVIDENIAGLPINQLTYLPLITKHKIN